MAWRLACAAAASALFYHTENASPQLALLACLFCFHEAKASDVDIYPLPTPQQQHGQLRTGWSIPYLSNAQQWCQTTDVLQGVMFGASRAPTGAFQAAITGWSRRQVRRMLGGRRGGRRMCWDRLRPLLRQEKALESEL